VCWQQVLSQTYMCAGAVLAAWADLLLRVFKDAKAGTQKR
jgi:hypothetical protein